MDSKTIVIIIGGIAIVIGIVCIIMSLRSRNKVRAMAETATATVAQAARMGTPAGTQRVEIYGMVECPSPLISPAGNRECVYYKYSVEELVREYDTDESGYRRTTESWRSVESDSQSTQFTISDQTGGIWVSPSGAEFVAREVMHDSPGSYGQRSQGLSTAGTVLDVVMGSSDISTGRFRTSESVIPVGQPAYVLGSVYSSQSGVQVAKGEGPFIVSCKSEAELQKKFKTHNVLWAVGGAVLGCGGIGAIVYGLFFMTTSA